MSILQQSSKAQDRTLGMWFSQIASGTLKADRLRLDFEQFLAHRAALVAVAATSLSEGRHVMLEQLLQDS